MKVITKKIRTTTYHFGVVDIAEGVVKERNDVVVCGVLTKSQIKELEGTTNTTMLGATVAENTYCMRLEDFVEHAYIIETPVVSANTIKGTCDEVPVVVKNSHDANNI